MQTIITHSGDAHRDDFLTCCILFALGKAEKIIRRDPSADELADSSTWVVDVGLRHEPALNNFDHHQPETADQCALSLLLTHLGMNVAATAAFQWYKPTIIWDSQGPKALAKFLDIKPYAINALYSPIEKSILRLFGSKTIVHLDSDLGYIMYEIGKSIVNYLPKFQDRWDKLTAGAYFRKINGVDVIYAMVDRDDPSLALSEFRAIVMPSAGASVILDNRGPGIALYRFDDHPKVDFRRIKGEPGIEFVHPNGFIAKTSQMLDSQAVDALLEKSIS